MQEQKPESSQNKTSAENPAGTVAFKEVTPDRSVQPPQQNQISEENRKALENLSIMIGIPQLVTELKKQREDINLIMTTLGGKSPAAGGPLAPAAGVGFMKPIMDKLPEMIDKGLDALSKWVQGPGPTQPTMISGIDKEIMEAAIKQTIEIKQKVALANEALARIYMGGGSVMVDQNGNAVILKPKKEEKKE